MISENGVRDSAEFVLCVLVDVRKDEEIMHQTRIKLNQTEDVKELVRAAEKCDFDVDVKCDSTLVDAKSILGVISLGLAKTVIIQCHGESVEFDNAIRKFAIA